MNYESYAIKIRKRRVKTDNISMFVHSTYYGIHDIDVVKAQEIWDGIKNPNNSQAQVKLAKNIYKIEIPLVNKEKSSLPFSSQATYIQDSVTEAWRFYIDNPKRMFLNRFPNPPQSDKDRKQIYTHIKTKLRNNIRDMIAKEIQEKRKVQKLGAKLFGFQSVFTDGIFSFEELRIVDNEYPQIFSDIEDYCFGGMVVAYMRLIHIDELFIETLIKIGIEEKLINKFKEISLKIKNVSKGEKYDKSENYRSILSTVFVLYLYSHTKHRGGLQASEIPGN